MPTGTTGDDLEELLNEHGGTGEWETLDTPAASTTPRWLFPRFDAALTIGTCTTPGHDGTHDSNEDCEDFTADPGNMYLSRSGLGPYDSDVETVAAWLAAPRNVVGAVNLLGDPGTGKTALIEAAVCYSDRDLTTHLCTPDDTRETLLLRFVGEGKGDPLPSGERSPYTLGPLAYAAMHGHVFYADEWMTLQDGVKVVLYSATDGRRFLPGGNVDGSALEFHPDFRVVLSSNPMVRGSSMPEPMASRTASTTITVETSASMLRDLAIDESVVVAWEALGTAGLWRPAIRELRLADYWLSVDPNQSVSAFLPEHCPESQRETIRNIVVGILGGSIRPDGRLVVS